MSVENNKAVTHQFFEGFWNNGNLAVLDEICAPTFIFHGFGTSAELKAAIAYFRTAFPDVHFTMEEMIAEGDKVVYRWTLQGTHQGDFAGISPTGKSVSETGISILRFIEGKIAEGRVETSRPTLEQQLA